MFSTDIMGVKYYAVNVGKITGVFRDWNIVKDYVIGFPGSKYKAFSNYEDAEYFYRTGTTRAINFVPDTVDTNITDIENNSGVLEIYTDGSCKNTKGGYGIVVVLGDGKYRSLKGPVPYTPCTNQIAELYAIYIAAQEYPDRDMLIYSDSEYCINIFTSWFENWKKNGWKRSGGKTIINGELIKDIERQIKSCDRKVSFKHVKAHMGHPINEMADALAKQGVNE